MKCLKAIIFDVDGTLAETESRGHLVAFNRAFGEMGLPWRWEPHQYAKLLEIGGGKERLVHFLSQQTADVPASERVALAERLHQLKTAHYRQIVSTGELPLRTGISRVIASALESNVRLAVATTSSEIAVHALVKSTLGANALDHFDVIAAGDVVAHKKPAADIYDYALHRLNLEATAAIAVEDSRIGMRAALGAHLSVIVTPSEFTQHDDFTGAAAIIDHLGDPDSACQQHSGCIDLQPMVTLKGIEQLLKKARRIDGDDA